MGMVSRIGRRTLRVRLALWSITLVLIAGSITMLYPFAMMLSGSTKSTTDASESRIIPSFLLGENSLWQKHIEGMFNEQLKLMQATYRSNATDFAALQIPEKPNAALAQAWLDFLKQSNLPAYSFTLGYLETPQTKLVIPSGLRNFRKSLSQKFHGDIEQLNAAMATSFNDWSDLTVVTPVHLLRSDRVGTSPLEIALADYSTQQPFADRVYFSVEGFYVQQYLKAHYPDIESYNAHHGTNYASYDDVHMARSLNDGAMTPTEKATWEEFVRTTISLLWLRADAAGAGPYRDYLEAKYLTIEAFNKAYQTKYESFDAIPIIHEPPSEGLALSDWDAFIQGWVNPIDHHSYMLPTNMLRIENVDFLFRDYLRQKFGSIAFANQSLGTNFADWMSILPPQQDVHYLDFQQKKAALRWEFISRNYGTVLDFMVLHGRALWNTIVYCTLAVLAALTINPMAAYALSRYRPKSTYRLLMFLMLTMAFPPMVTQIPVFLMLRDFHLLNTYWALVLPGLANGYSIFLLKGFFDSLPQELYESATIDGASEFRIFWQITMSLSKPILAVIALAAFTAAYSNFIFALLLVQDRSMWTLMVWLYDFQVFASDGPVFASLTLAAIPTMLAFVLCQKVIMQGIVVPVEK